MITARIIYKRKKKIKPPKKGEIAKAIRELSVEDKELQDKYDAIKKKAELHMSGIDMKGVKVIVDKVKEVSVKTETEKKPLILTEPTNKKTVILRSIDDYKFIAVHTLSKNRIFKQFTEYRWFVTKTAKVKGFDDKKEAQEWLKLQKKIDK